MVPVEANVEEACEPPPTITALDVRLAADVTQVAHPTVPVVVMVPPVRGELNTIEVTLPDPGGVAHVPSPRQKVEALAEVPPLRLVTGRLPVISVAIFTEAKEGAPVPPCSTVVVEPSEPSADIACPPPPISRLLSVNAAALVVQVAQAMVPDVVIVPPVIGELVAIEVMVPVPAGVAQIPSPLQKVELEASVPLFR